MKHSDQPRIELERARAALDSMIHTDQIAEREERWKEFFRRLDRVWNKAFAHYSKSGKWGGWHGRYSRLRTTDQLLAYLMQARNADEHRVEAITERRFTGGPGTRLDEDDDRYAHLGDLAVVGGASLVAPGIEPIYFLPQVIELQTVVNRGKAYAPPTQHLGRTIDPRDLFAAARLAVKFYEDFLLAAETYFVK